MSLRLEIDEDLEKKFREAAMREFGYGKGSLRKASEVALLKWVNERSKRPVKEVENPVKLIKGMLSKYRGKYTSVELQHEATKIWDLLEAEKLSLFMYTSCGWFFDELSGIEPLIVMRFAARVIERIRLYAPHEFESTFFSILKGAKSNLPEQGTGEDIFKRNIHGF